MFIHVKDVRHIGDYRLRIVFTDNVIKDVDLTNELYGEVFSPLRDLTIFSQVAVNPETGTIEWPNGADFAPEFLFEVGEEVKQAA